MAKKVAAAAVIVATPVGVRIQMVPLGHLRKWPRNPKGHDIPAIKASFDRFGFVQNLVIDEKSGNLVAGHGRLQALVELKDAGAQPPKRIEVRDGEWLVPVLRGIEFASEREAEDYLLADNRLTEKGGWEPTALAPILLDFQRDSYVPIGWMAARWTSALVRGFDR
jgi:hypothetical protein